VARSFESTWPASLMARTKAITCVNGRSGWTMRLVAGPSYTAATQKAQTQDHSQNSIHTFTGRSRGGVGEGKEQKKQNGKKEEDE